MSYHCDRCRVAIDETRRVGTRDGESYIPFTADETARYLAAHPPQDARLDAKLTSIDPTDPT